MSEKSMLFNSVKNNNLHQIYAATIHLIKPGEKLRKKDANIFIDVNKKSNITNKRNKYG